MVMAPARTGSESNSRKAVTRIDHTNSGILCRVIPGARMLKIVVMKLMAPKMEEAPAIWIEKMARSIAGPGEPYVERGAYSVQPPPTPMPPESPSTNIDSTSKVNENGNSQNEILFIRGK